MSTAVAPAVRARRRATADFAIAGGGAVVYGSTVLFSRVVAKNGLGPVTALVVRFGIAGILLLCVLAARRRPLLPPEGERVRAVSLGFLYVFESTCFFLALEHGTAGAVTLLFYVYPAVVTAVELLLRAIAPQRSVFAAITLSTAGAVGVAVGGGSVSIAPVGIAFAMGSVACFTCYALASARLLHRTDALTAAAWTAIGATVGMLVVGVASGQLRALGPSLPPLLANGVATATAFTLFFVAIGRLGASRTSVVMTLEAVSAVVLTAIFLGEAVQPLEALGGVAVLAGAAIASFAGRRRGEIADTP